MSVLHGSEGTKELAEEVVKIAESSDTSKFTFTYDDDMSLEDKIRSVAQKIYRADDIVIDKAISDQLKGFEESGYGKLPICIAKTQYSFSTNPALRGAPTGFTVPVREVRLSAGAGFIVVVNPFLKAFLRGSYPFLKPFKGFLSFLRPCKGLPILFSKPFSRDSYPFLRPFYCNIENNLPRAKK